MVRPFGGATHTYATLFSEEKVDNLVGDACLELEADYERRKEYMTDENQKACEARLALLRNTWTTLKDPAR
jgi:hypothetical protein